MKKLLISALLAAGLVIGPMTGITLSETPAPEAAIPAAAALSHDAILKKLESRYNAADFSARFDQKSHLKALDITDTAAGRVWFKHPGMMRWEYETPEKYAIISDGKTLWIYRPEDNQVIIGDAMTYFSNGKGASFLSNFSLVQDAYAVSLAEPDQAERWALKLVPRKKQLDLSAIFLNIDRTTFDIKSVRTATDYGDETHLEFSELKFAPTDPDLFHFRIPPGADILTLEE